MQNCTKCLRKNLWRKTGNWVKVMGEERREMICRCGHRQLEEPSQEWTVKPKVLYLDIETSTTQMVVDVFDMKVHSGWLDWHDITQPFYVICWSAAWVGEKVRVIADGVTGDEAITRRDKRHLLKLRELLDRADVVTGHNSKLFDLKKIETRFVMNEIPKPYPYKQFDTLAFAKKHFKAESNALAYWSRLLGGNPKDKMCRDDWLECNKGNERVIRKMLHYNKGDVREGVNVLNKFVAYAESDGITQVFK